ncbi:MAG: dTDP-4-dehydrorhamnose reductase [Chloroflexota bacterium]|jgi:dTDP-4-dehydrorhamnose reductase
MQILITGSKGQLGAVLASALSQHELYPADLPEIDVTNRDEIFNAIQSCRPDIVIHCAAYTDVDGCARDPELAYRVNSMGTQNVALACREVAAAMVHISTNEVFSGENTQGYEEWMPLSPRNPYGVSKAAAEHHVCALLDRYYIVRTAWLFAPGGRNFIHSILTLARDTGEIRVVADEIGNPTYGPDLAEAIGRLIETGQYGIYHFVNRGATSRWAFANEILHLTGLTETVNIPILNATFRRTSSPPPFSALHNRNGDALGISFRPWQEALADYLQNDLSQ